MATGSPEAQSKTDGSTRLSFGPFVVDPETRSVLEGNTVHPLAPKPFETLLYLAGRPGRVVSKAELMEQLWPQTFVTDDVLVQCVVEIRRVLGDPAKSPRYVRTVPRKGYQFLAQVAPVDEAPPPAPPTTATPDRPPLVEPIPAPERQRSWRRPAAAVGLAAALIAGALLFAARRRPMPPEASGVEPGSLLILPMTVQEPRTQSDWLRQGLAEMLRSQLGQTPGIHVLPRHRVAAALAEAGYDEDKTVPAPAATLVARRLRAERLITGSFVRVEDRFVLNADVVDTATGRTEGTASVRGQHPAGVLDAVEELSLSLLTHLRPSGSSSDRWRPTRLTTRSVEASRHYVEALTCFARGGRRGAEEAEAHLDQALKLDPAFAQAYLKKAEILQWRRQWGHGDPDPAPAVRDAARLVKDLPERERLLVASFEGLIVQRQPQVALRHWNALLQFYPTYGQEIGIPGLAADTLMSQGRWDELIMIGEAHVDSPSLPEGERARLCSLLANAFRQKGELERAMRYAQRAVGVWPVREGPRFLGQRTTLGRIALEAGRRGEALAEFQAVRDAPEADAINLTSAAWGFYMAGARDDAAGVVEKALAQDPSYGNAYHLRGWLELAGGEYGAATNSFETAFERTPRSFGNPHQGLVSGDLAAHYYAGVAYLLGGDQVRAAETFHRLIAYGHRLRQSGLPDEAAQWQVASFLARAAARLGLPAEEPPRLAGDDTTYFVQSARLHAVQGKRDQALKELAQGIGLGHGEYTHLQDDPDFASLRGEPEFKRLVTERLGR